MPSKKKQDKERDPDIHGSNDHVLEERVKKMLDPSVKDEPTPKSTKPEEASEALPSISGGAGGAAEPEITELPKPKEPLKIKILHDNEADDSGDDKADPDVPPTAPELKDEKPAKESTKIHVTEHEEENAEPEEEPKAETEPESDTESAPEPEEETLPPEEEKSESSFAEATEDKESLAEASEQLEEEKTEPSQPEKKPRPKKEKPKEPEPEIPPIVEDEKTAKAVDDIIAHESDELLKKEDDKLLSAVAPKKKSTIGAKLKSFILSKKFAKSFSAILVLTVAALAIYPQTRYMMLNLFGVRSSVSLRVLDESTFQPLKNVEVSINGASGKSDTEGHVTLTQVKLGAGDLLIHKRAFADHTRRITVGWGSNPLGDFNIKPTGIQYAFIINDFVSDYGLEMIEVISGEFSALSDHEGKALLTMDEPPEEIEVRIVGAGLRDENVKLDADTKEETTVKMVPDRKHVFITKRSGKYDLYKIDADGQNEKKVLAGTGNERDDLSLIPHPTQEIAALVTTRSGKRNKDGFLLSTLTVIDIKNNGVQPVITSERVQLIDWIGDNLIFVTIRDGASAVDPKRHRLMSYNYKTNKTAEIATTNSFNDVMVINGKLYYAPSGAYQNGVNVSLFRVDGDGNNKYVLLGDEAWNLFRVSYDHVVISAPDAWYDYRLGDEIPTSLEGPPADLKSRVYVNNPDNSKSLWVDNRDGKGVLIVHDVGNGKEETLQTLNGLRNPLSWLNNTTAVFRLKTDSESADYAVSVNGGEPKKIRDVTNTDGIDTWYYY